MQVSNLLDNTVNYAFPGVPTEKPTKLQSFFLQIKPDICEPRKKKQLLLSIILVV